MNRAELTETLILVGRALADNDLIPIFRCFSFDGKTVTAANGTLAIVAPCKTSVKFAVDGKTLLGLLGNSHADEVEFSIDGHDLITKTGRSTFKLPFYPTEDFLFKQPREDTTLELTLHDEFWVGLEACLQTTSKDQTQPALMGVCLRPSSMGLYSCNGDALSRFKLPVTTVDAPDCMLPNSFCDSLLAIAGATVKQGDLHISDKWAVAMLDNKFSIYGELIENPNPLDFEAEITKTLKLKPRYVKVPATLEPALNRARVLSDVETTKTVLMVEQNRMRLVTTNKMGVVRDTLELKGHENAEAHVSAEMIQGAISLCTEMAVLENCCVFKNDQGLFVLTSNME